MRRYWSKVLLRLHGCVRYRKSKGYTLLELVVYLSISIIILSLGIKCLFEGSRSLNFGINKVRNINKAINGLNSVEYLAKKDAVTEINVIGDDLLLYEEVEEKLFYIRRIKKVGTELKVFHYLWQNGSQEDRGNYPIMKEIDDFKAVRKGNIIYLVVVKGGEEYIRCL